MNEREPGLAEFLKARRKLLGPEEVGLVGGGERRVPGLRREEVALLAGVSTDYYVRLEQGRVTRPSVQVLGAVARALRLDHQATDHLYRLGLPHLGELPATEGLSDEVARLLRSLSGVPAFVVDPTLDVLAANTLARRLYRPFARFDNLLGMIFLDPAAHTFYRDWDAAARGVVSHLRVVSAPFLHDRHVARRVAELSSRSPEFARLWGRYEVAERVSEDKKLRHPDVGDLVLHYESLAISSAPGQHLATYSAAAGSPSEARLEELARGRAPQMIAGEPRPLSSPVA